MAKQFFRIEGPEEIIKQLEAEAAPDGVEIGKSQPKNSLADAVDAPLGPDEITQILQLLTVAFTTATAALAFLEKVRSLLRAVKTAEPAKVVIRDARSNKQIAVVDASTNVATVAEDIVK